MAKLLCKGVSEAKDLGLRRGVIAICTSHVCVWLSVSGQTKSFDLSFAQEMHRSHVLEGLSGKNTDQEGTMHVGGASPLRRFHFSLCPEWLSIFFRIECSPHISHNALMSETDSKYLLNLHS